MVKFFRKVCVGVSILTNISMGYNRKLIMVFNIKSGKYS